MEVNGILGLLILLADIYAIVQIVQSRVTTGMKAIWILLVLILPVVGLIIWFIAGPRDRSA